MTTRTVYWDRALPELSKELRQTWLTWIARHGLPDLADIPLYNTLVCDDDACTITLDQWRRNENGKHYLEPNPDLDLAEKRMVRERISIQLEAPALPLPLGYEVRVA